MTPVNTRRAWTCTENRRFFELAGKVNGKAIASELNRSYYAIRNKASREGVSLTHAHDDIRVGGVVLPYIPERRGWMKPDGTVTRNPLIAQRVAEELNQRKGE